MSLENLILYIISSFIIGSLPGPSVWFAISSSLQFGVRRALYAVYGQIAGNVLHVAVVVFGIGAIVESNYDVLSYLKYIGAVYLLYLAFTLIKSGRGKNGTDLKLKEKSPHRLFWEGFLVCISNPKLFIHFIIFMPQFVEPGSNEMLQLAILAVLNFPLGFLILYMYVAAADYMRRWLSSDFSEKYLNKISGGIIGLVALLLVLHN